MTYEEYKKGSKNERNNILKIFLSKLFTIVIFSMIVIITSNTNEQFRNFLINDVLNSTMDFSKVNNTLDNMSGLFKENQDKQVFNEISEKVIEIRRHLHAHPGGALQVHAADVARKRIRASAYRGRPRLRARDNRHVRDVLPLAA